MGLFHRGLLQEWKMKDIASKTVSILDNFKWHMIKKNIDTTITDYYMYATKKNHTTLIP